MDDIARFYARVLLKNETPKKIREEIKQFRADYQELRYCFKEGFRGYDYHALV